MFNISAQKVFFAVTFIAAVAISSTLASCGAPAESINFTLYEKFGYDTIDAKTVETTDQCFSFTTEQTFNFEYKKPRFEDSWLNPFITSIKIYTDDENAVLNVDNVEDDERYNIFLNIEARNVSELNIRIEVNGYYDEQQPEKEYVEEIGVEEPEEDPETKYVYLASSVLNLASSVISN